MAENENKEVAIPDISGFLADTNGNESFIDFDMGDFGFSTDPETETEPESKPESKTESDKTEEVNADDSKKDKGGDEKETKEKENAIDDKVEKNSPTTDNYDRAFAIAQDLVEDGVLDSFDKEKFKDLYDELGVKAVTEMLKIQHNEALTAAFKEMETSIIEYYEGIYNAPEQKEFFNLLKKGIDFETAKQVFTEKKAYESVSDKELEDNDTLCEKIIKADYERQGLSESRIKRMWDKIKDDPDAIYEDAVEARNNLKEASVQKEKQLIEHQKQKEIEEQNIREQQKLKAEKAREQLNLYIVDMKSVGDIKITETDRKKIYANLTTPVDYVPDPATGQKRPVFFLETIRAKNPNAFNAALTLYAMKGLFNIDSSGNFKPDFSYFDSKAEKKVKSNLESLTEKRIIGSTTSSNGKESRLSDIF